MHPCQSLPIFVLLLAVPAVSADSSEQRARAVLGKYCVECHNDKVHRGKLRLDDLPGDFVRYEELWKTVLARLAEQTMPPKNKPRPAASEARELVEWISAGLKSAQVERLAKEGRSRLRRLNRVQYAATVRDLLAIDADLSELLPEDGSLGFDNVDSALHLSPVLLERYLAAADAALDAAIVRGPRPSTVKKRYSYLDEKAFQGYVAAGKSMLARGDAIVFFNSRNGPPALGSFKAAAPGRYRFRLSVSAHQSKEPVTFRVYLGNFLANAGGRSYLAGYFEAPPGKFSVIEVTGTLRKNDTIRIIPYGTGAPWFNDGKIATYTGPGLAVQWVETEGPLIESWPPESHRVLLGDVLPSKGTAEDARRLLARFLPRAFRRPVPEAEAAPYLKLFRTRQQQGDNFEQAMRVVYKAVLCSPDFLFFREKPGKLDAYALACRLSYLLWSSMPDRTLFDLAARGRLGDPEVLRGQVERMLKDAKAAAFTEHFTGQWLSLRDINFTTPDRNLYPEFDEALQVAMVQETHAFFDEVLKNDLSLLNFVHSDFAMLNERLARHYGIPGVKGLHLRKVTLRPEYRRGGVLTQASVLKVTANGTTTSPVIRGAWVLDRLLGKPAPPPPPDVPAVEPDIRGAVAIRDQLARHRTDQNCASCHSRIDPPGFALESYDPIGGWRDRYRVVGEKGKPAKKDDYLTLTIDGRPRRLRLGPKVQPGDTLADGRKFADLEGFKKLLLQDHDQITRNLAEKLLVYATGHALELSDQDTVEEIVRRVKAKNHGFRTLLHEVIQSPTFQSK